ncbi:MAG: hypothetical protein CMJ83_19760, partial [Planctomycetes bacterium]|nr:hypothetical protein [Planctomycetota bacterium]
MDVLDRARGALLGMAVGEALGAPLEGLEPEMIEEKIGKITGYLDARKTQPEHRSGFFVHAVYEDETQAALAMSETLVRKGGFDVDALKTRLEELGQTIDGNTFGCYRRPRRNFRTAVRRMLSGAAWEECGVNTAGSGAASRGIPIGVFYRDDRDQRLRASVESSLLTHRDPRAGAATASVAEAVAIVCALESPGDAKPAAIAKEIAAAARDAEELMAEKYETVLYPGYEPYLHQYSGAAAELQSLVALDIEPAFQKIIGWASDKGSRPITHATRGFSLTAVTSALYLFLTGLESFEDCVLDTICEGGNTDTLGCLVGGLCGALHGVDGIPAAWRETLKGADQVLGWGDALSGEADRGALPSLIAQEARLTPPAPPPPRKKRPVPQPRHGPGRDGPSGGRGRDGGRGGHGGGRGGGGGRPGGGRGRDDRRDDRRGGG